MSLTTNKLRALLLSASINLSTATLKAMLLNTSYTPDKDHDFANDLNTYELSGTGYTGGFSGSGRKTLSSVTVVQDDTNDLAKLDADDVTWTAIDAGTAGYIAVINEQTSDGDSPIVAIVSLSSPLTTNGGDYTHQWGSDGIIKLTSP